MVSDHSCLQKFCATWNWNCISNTKFLWVLCDVSVICIYCDLLY